MLLALTAGAVGCGDGGSNTVAGGSCSPACRDGFTCVAGACVSACNPPCSGFEVCDTTGASARCVTRDAGVVQPDTGAPADAVAKSDTGVVATDTGSFDSGAPVDSGNPVTDAGAFDAAPVTDRGAPNTDTGVADVGVDAGPCGGNGERCCNNRLCLNGGLCENMVCRAPTMREMGECTSPADCSGMTPTCAGIFTCAEMRGCWRCTTTTGTRAFGVACQTGTECATGLCARGRCTVPCALGSGGDSQCSARGAGYVCAEITFRPANNAPVTTLGSCQQSCRRNADCAAGTACVPYQNNLTDRLEFFCAPTTLTSPIGASCDPNGTATCQSSLCLPTNTNMGFCTGPCESDTDCTPAAPQCGDIFLFAPSGRSVPARGCVTRRP